jgi:hypothetical protein
MSPEAKKEEARKYFEKGLLLFDDESWDGALAEFLRSREMYPGRAATKNAAICLRKLKRYEESLAMFEELLRIPNLPPADRDVAEHELIALRGFVGTVEVRGAEAGATVIVDGRNRGTAPVPPIRLSVGTHVVRVYKEGFEAFETRIDVPAGAAEVVDAKLPPLLRSGRLKVVERANQALDVVVDGAVVGKTPWEGPLAPGDHTVLLRGDGELGTQPATVPVTLNGVTPITLAAEPLGASLKIQPTPSGASIAIDGVNVSRGLWEGRLRVGPHHVEVGAEGFLPLTKDVTLGAGIAELTGVVLERDPNSPIWTENRGRFFVELDPAFGLVPSYGSDIQAGCAAPCSKGLGIGVLALGQGGYRFRGGFTVGLQAGYLFLTSKTTNRSTSVTPMGLPADPGTATDAVTLSGGLVGAAAAYRLGFLRLPLTIRLGAGALLGSMKDHRTGSFNTVARTVNGVSIPSTSYQADVTESLSVNSLYLSPEVRLGFRLGEHFELSIGAQALVLLIFTPPKWVPNDRPVLAATDGQGVFPAETLTGKTVVVVTPGLGAKYDF